MASALLVAVVLAAIVGPWLIASDPVATQTPIKPGAKTKKPA